MRRRRGLERAGICRLRSFYSLVGLVQAALRQRAPVSPRLRKADNRAGVAAPGQRCFPGRATLQVRAPATTTAARNRQANPRSALGIDKKPSANRAARRVPAACPPPSRSARAHSAARAAGFEVASVGVHSARRGARRVSLSLLSLPRAPCAAPTGRPARALSSVRAARLCCIKLSLLLFLLLPSDLFCLPLLACPSIFRHRPRTTSAPCSPQPASKGNT